MIYLITYLIFAVIVASLSVSRRITFAQSFLVSLFLTPIVGLIIVLKTKQNILFHRYFAKQTCPDCGNEFIISNNTCPKCGYELVNLNKIGTLSIS